MPGFAPGFHLLEFAALLRGEDAVNFVPNSFHRILELLMQSFRAYFIFSSERTRYSFLAQLR
jgi:hypothetical protein